MFIQEETKAPTVYSVVRNDELLAMLVEYVYYLEGVYNNPLIVMISATDSILKLKDKISTINKKIDNLRLRIRRGNDITAS